MIKITMTPEEKNQLHIWWLLQQIKEGNLATPSNSVVHFITGNTADDTENIPSTKKRNLLMCKFDEDLKIIKILEVEESNHYNGFTTTFFFNILQPKFDNTYKHYQTWAEYLKDPKGFQKKDITYIKARREIIEKNINTIYANINYLDKAEKDGWERKLDVLKIIWTFYHSNNKPNTLRIPIQSLTTKGRNIYEADGILDGLEKEGCWYIWHRGSVNYELEVIYYNDLLNAYNRTKEIYSNYATTQLTKDFTQEVKENKTPPKTIGTKEKHFNHNDSSLIFNSEIYKPSDEVRKKIIRILWSKKRTKHSKGTIIDGGERIRKPELAVLSEFIKNEQEFNIPKIKQDFSEIIKQLDRIFGQKNFPLAIDTNKEGILMIHTEM